MEAAPVEMLPYIHFPNNWNSWYNPFNPNGYGPKLYTVLSWLNPFLLAALIIYAVILWRKGRFKRVIDKWRGKANEED